MGTTIFMLNKFRPRVISLLDPTTGEMVSSIAINELISIDPERVFVVDEWALGDGKKDNGHFAGRLLHVCSIADEAKQLREEQDLLLRVIDECVKGPCPRCGAKRLTRITMEWICNAEIDDDGKRCDFRQPLGFGLSKGVPDLNDTKIHE